MLCGQERMKVCCRCKQAKCLDGFGVDRKAKDGHSYRCKQCTKESNKHWYQANREKVIATARAWDAANPEKVAERKLAYAARYPERVKEANRKYGLKPDVVAKQKADPRRKAYQKQRREACITELKDEYVRRVLAQRLSITGSALPQALVDAHREVMKIKRYINEQRQ